MSTIFRVIAHRGADETDARRVVGDELEDASLDTMRMPPLVERRITQ